MVLNFLVIHLMLGRLGGIRPARTPLLVGAGVGAVVIEVLKQVMALLVAFVIDKPQYGAFSAPIGIMFVLFLQSSALYLVASLTAALAEVQAGGRSRTRPTRAGLKRPLDRGKVDRPRPHASTSQRPRGRCRGWFSRAPARLPATSDECFAKSAHAVVPLGSSFVKKRPRGRSCRAVTRRFPSGCRVTAADAGSAGPSPAPAPPARTPSATRPRRRAPPTTTGDRLHRACTGHEHWEHLNTRWCTPPFLTELLPCTDHALTQGLFRQAAEPCRPVSMVERGGPAHHSEAGTRVSEGRHADMPLPAAAAERGGASRSFSSSTDRRQVVVRPTVGPGATREPTDPACRRGVADAATKDTGMVAPLRRQHPARRAVRGPLLRRLRRRADGPLRRRQAGSGRVGLALVIAIIVTVLGAVAGSSTTCWPTSTASRASR